MNKFLPSTDYSINQAELLRSIEPTSEEAQEMQDIQYFQEFDRKSEQLILSMPQLTAYRLA